MEDILSQQMMTKVSLSSTTSNKEENNGQEEAMAAGQMMAFETPKKSFPSTSSSFTKPGAIAPTTIVNTPGTAVSTVVDMSFDEAVAASPVKQQLTTDSPNSTGSRKSVGGRVTITKDGVCVKMNNKGKVASNNYPTENVDSDEYGAPPPIHNIITTVPSNTSSNDSTTLVTCDWVPKEKIEKLQASTGWNMRKEDSDEKQQRLLEEEEQQRRKDLEETKLQQQPQQQQQRRTTTIPYENMAVPNKTTAASLAKKYHSSKTDQQFTTASKYRQQQHLHPFDVANKTTTAWLAKKHPETKESFPSIRPKAAGSKNQLQPFDVANKATTSWLAKKNVVETTAIPTLIPSSKKRKQVTPFNVASKTTKSFLAKHQNKDDDVDMMEETDHYHHNSNLSRKKRKVSVPAVANKATASWLAKHQPKKEEEKEEVASKTIHRNKHKPTVPKEIVSSRPTFSFLAKKKSNTDDDGRTRISCPRVLQRMKKFTKRLKKGIIKPKNYTPSLGSKESTACSISHDADCTSGVFPQQQHYHKFTHCDDTTVSLLSVRSTTSSNLKQKNIESFTSPDKTERSKSPLLYNGFLLGDTSY